MNEALEQVLREIRAGGVAVPFGVVVERLRGRGAAVTEGVLERALRSEDSGVRLLDPWAGPHAVLRPLMEDSPPLGLWVVPLPPACPPEPVPDAGDHPRLHRALRCLARTLDDRSPGDVARWVGMVHEARSLRRAA
ncbi:MAG TPA: hypothetical protein VK858_13190 [Longimicrobiales bacterium]|nr:hypothetical protein [Longimicrobiales bacterium]